jgi:crotonobetainyl-CoA:carnitine CoA-transferase CaiB-like acyl-CoA transferase
MHGIRVLDATAWWAGPTAGQVLAALGAEVIHLESVQHPDPMRFMVGPAGKLDHWWERSSLFLGSNVNKLGLTLDLQDVRGREVAIDLIRQSDVMFENFSPRVFDSFGFDHSRILEINPRIVFVRMPAFGLDGPWRNNVGFAQTMEQVTGQAWLTGFVEEGPSIPRGPCDPLAGYQAVFAAMVGLARRERDGEGCFIESAMVEAVLGVTAEQVIEYTGHGRILERDGNRSPDAAPQGLYRCQGHEQWLALSILDDRQWQALKLALGSPEWAEDASLDEASGRAAAQDVIDEHLGRWAVDHEAAALVERLLAFGIPAGMMRDPRWLFDHPQFQDLRYFEIVEHPVAGAVTVVAVPFRYASVAGWVRSPAPLLGEHNERVLSGILGLGEDAIKLLSADQVIGTRPSNL